MYYSVFRQWSVSEDEPQRTLYCIVLGQWATPNLQQENLDTNRILAEILINRCVLGSNISVGPGLAPNDQLN